MEEAYNNRLSSLFGFFKEIEKGLKGCNQRALEFSCQMQGKDLSLVRNLDLLSEHIKLAEEALHSILGLFDDFHQEFAPCFNYSAPQFSWLPKNTRNIPMTYVSGDNPCEINLAFKDGPHSDLILREIKQRLQDSALRPFAFPPEPGMSVICASDDLIFRGIVVRQDEEDEEIFQVYDVDAQVHHMVPVGELSRLPAELQHYHASVLRCCITERVDFLDAWNKEDMPKLFKSVFMQSDITLNIIKEVESTRNDIPPKFMTEITLRNAKQTINLQSWFEDVYPIDGIYKIFWEPDVKQNLQMGYVSGSSPWEIYLMYKNGPDFDLICSKIKEIAQAGALKPLTQPPKDGMSVVCCNLAFRFRGVVVGPAEGKRIKVFNVDTNMQHEVSIDALYQLPESLSELQAAILCCCLTKDESLKKDWSEEMDNVFVSVLATHEIEVSIIKRIESKGTCPKFLVNMVVHGQSGTFNISSFLESEFNIKGSSASTPTSSEPELCAPSPICFSEVAPSEYGSAALSFCDEFEPDEHIVTMLEELDMNDESLTQSFVEACDGLIDTSCHPDDLQLEEADLNGGYFPRDEQEICLYFSKHGKCTKPSCNLLHVRKVQPLVEHQWTQDKVSVHYDTIQHLHLPPEDSIVLVKPTSIRCNTAFYGILLDSDLVLPNLNRVLDDLNEKFGKFERLVLEPSLGEICAALSSTGKWFRGRVIRFRGDHKYLVFDVDSGVTEEMPKSRLRVLPVDYLHLPFQAILFFVNNCDILQKVGFMKSNHKVKIKSYIGDEPNVELID